MTKTVTSAAVIIPPEEKWEPIQQIRKKHDKKIDRWMPHINLLYPFIPKEDYENSVDQIKHNLREIDPFMLSLKEFNYFQHKYQTYTLWLDPTPRKKISTLQRALLKTFPNCNDVNRFRGGFQPHLSVGQFVTYNINNVIEKLQKNWDPLEFLCENIHLISRKNTKDSSFHIVKTIPLPG
ncbi:MAG: 2'-5' RNA ligase family protein [Candidatus Lokiarchaeota archaeon]|nr:2'-5' RNA ligase family protein [Candidatus Lokiarchaeota archaeon]MBD3202578.1 2'-5' RNA ligase family protein [Candidatus Lokiarchaeota archaeon]